MSKIGFSKNRPRLDPELWVDQYGDYLFRFVHSRVRDSRVAEDLVQETFLAALRARKTFDGRSAERTWLTGILKHKIVDYIRKQSRELPVDNIESLADLSDEFFDDKGRWKVGPVKWIADPTKLYEQKEFLEIVYRCLSKLTDRLSKAFTLREMDGLSTEEICKVLNITATNCWVLLYRARMGMRHCLEVNWFGKIPGKET